ncbi:MAG: glycosyltransferase family 4 protein [Anaerolineae bacterium]|nr:glycosyltransferase family 4 protein [Anaerolineae bacterium]
MELTVLTKKKAAFRNNSLVQSISAVFKRLMSPGAIDYYAGPLFIEDLRALVHQHQPDVLFAYTFDAASLITGIDGVVRVASVVDLDHIARRERQFKKAGFHPINTLKHWIDLILLARMPGVMVSILRQCDLVFEHASHHKQWLKAQGLQKIDYHPVLVLDYASNVKKNFETRIDSQRPIKISLVGKVNGVATLTGLRLLATELLPILRQDPACSDCEIHVIGGGQLPGDLAQQLNDDQIIIRGFVEDIQAEFLNSDIILVPTPIDLGFRTRIAEAFSYGCCVVAHSANAEGMPELRHGDNGLLGDTGASLAAQLLRAVKSADLRRQLGEAARKTFERELSGDVNSDLMLEKIEGLVRQMHDKNAFKVLTGENHQ